MTDEQWATIAPFVEAREAARRTVHSIAMTNWPTDLKEQTTLALQADRAGLEYAAATRAYNAAMERLLG